MEIPDKELQRIHREERATFARLNRHVEIMDAIETEIEMWDAASDEIDLDRDE